MKFKIGEEVIINNLSPASQPARPDGMTCGMKGTIRNIIEDRVLVETSPVMVRWYREKNLLKTEKEK